MKCHYEVLELARDADESEIKSAYRKLALKWHPDKNLDNQNFAKEQFQIVQQAYEVLSDRQERAWYDAHRDQILHGANSEFQDKSLDVFQYFTTTCFKGYGDDEEGFYGVYRKVFEQIAKEDIDFIDEKEEFCEIPGFGGADSDYETVKAFYDYWMSYSTKKSYSWLDPYDIREGKGNRRLLKLIEKDNKKVRLKARKERNEEVRNLVAFVRKRDKRVQAFKKELEAKTMENRRKQEELSKQKRLERKQMHATEKQADWLKFDNVKSELEEIEKQLAQEFGEELIQSEEEDEDEDFNNLYCVACNKMFKTHKAFENHELSKKHRDNVEKLKEAMLSQEDIESNLTEDSDEYVELEDDNLEQQKFEESEGISEEDSIADDENMPEITENINNSSETDKLDASGQSSDNPMKKSKKAKKNKNILNTSHNDTINHISEEIDIGRISDDDFDFSTSKSQKKKKKNNKIKPTAPNREERNDNKESNTDNILDNNEASKKQTKKGNKKNKEPTDLNEIDVDHSCVTCKSNFPSKNKLFDHLKKTGHGVYLPSKVKHNNSSSKKDRVK